LNSLKKRLSENRLSSPLFDTPLFTNNLETAYMKIYERYRGDLQLDHLHIT